MPILTTESGYRLIYIDGREAWYTRTSFAVDQLPYLTVARSADAGGVAWEFVITDYTSRLRVSAVRIQMFDDAFVALAEVPELFAALAQEGAGVTLDRVREVLDGLGFVDDTPRVSPYEDQPRETAITTPKPKLIISDETIAEAKAMEERDRRAGGPPWEVPEHPENSQPGGWHHGQLWGGEWEGDS